MSPGLYEYVSPIFLKLKRENSGEAKYELGAGEASLSWDSEVTHLGYLDVTITSQGDLKEPGAVCQFCSYLQGLYQMYALHGKWEVSK